jgi:hypothetical protein
MWQIDKKSEKVKGMGNEEKLNKEKVLENAKKELAMIEKQLLDTEKFLELGKKEYELKCANHEVALKNYKIVRPTWAFEEDQAYLDNMREMSLIGFERFKLQTEDKIREQEKLVESLNEQIAGHILYINKLESELEGVKENE